MEQQQQQQQQGGKGRAPKGEGYTVRVNGRKVLMTKVLEERVGDLQLQCEGLQAENDALRAKEAEQMKCLEFYDVWVKRIAAANSAPPDCPQDSNDSSNMPRPARLERQAKQLLRDLKQQPELESHDSCLQAATRSTATHATSPHNSSSSAAAVVGATSSGSRGSSAHQPEEKMARWHSCITPEDLSYFSNVSAEDLAVRLCDIVARLEVAHRRGGPQQQQQGAGSESAFEVLEEMGRLCAVQVVGNEKALAKVMGMNLATQKVEQHPPGLWQRVAEAADLQPQQKATVTEAYRSFSEAVGKLKQQQHSLMEQLQAVLGVGPALSSKPGSAAAAAAGVAADAAPAGPSHFMSLATGEPVAGASVRDEAAAAAAEQESEADYSTPRAVTDSPMHLETASSPVPDAFVAFLRDYLHDCKDRAAAVTTTSSLTSSGATGSSGGSSSSWLAPAGVLALQDAERAEELLHRLARISPSIQQQVHQLTIMFVNLLTTEQRAEVVLTAYPYMVTATDFCAAVAQGEAQQQQPTATTRRGRAQRSTARRVQAGKNPRMP